MPSMANNVNVRADLKALLLKQRELEAVLFADERKTKESSRAENENYQEMRKEKNLFNILGTF